MQSRKHDSLITHSQLITGGFLFVYLWLTTWTCDLCDNLSCCYDASAWLLYFGKTYWLILTDSIYFCWINTFSVSLVDNQGGDCCNLLWGVSDSSIFTLIAVQASLKWINFLIPDPVGESFLMFTLCVIIAQWHQILTQGHVLSCKTEKEVISSQILSFTNFVHARLTDLHLYT